MQAAEDTSGSAGSCSADYHGSVKDTGPIDIVGSSDTLSAVDSLKRVRKSEDTASTKQAKNKTIVIELMQNLAEKNKEVIKHPRFFLFSSFSFFFLPYFFLQSFIFSRCFPNHCKQKLKREVCD